MQTQENERHMINVDPREQAYYQPTNARGRYRRERQRIGIGPVWVVLTILIIGIVFWGLVAFRQTAALPIHTFKVAGRARLVVSNTAGVIHIHQGKSDSIVVRGTKYTRGIGGSLDDVQVSYQQQGDTVSVTSDETWSLMNMHGVQLDITVPATTDLKIDNASGNVDIERINGTIEAQTESGSVEADHLSGTLNLSSDSGGIHLNDASGVMMLSTVSGGIEANHIQLQGQSRLTTTSGGIKFQGTLDPYGNYHMEAVSGGIDLTLPSNAAFKLDASTTSGGIHNAFGTTTTGSAPQPALTLHTTSGGIDINEQ
ncbi:hypothetical protein KSF_038830 [Reticulibacter mediterranei]|uniref:DUF4097 domain-containing protein n=1 Tax=Reticulibacter mediterranei TaxID=2778369 RepID=A0A8J3N347_9CHLR|nr:DUF4097 family beta strand repeat-containing protein [Reticulibacter mediterranei]GHO93835.1 hypothetical protein KSF_038830 [Reticulibacter mediterranei]